MRSSAHIRRIWTLAKACGRPLRILVWAASFLRGETGRATGWLARAQRLLEREGQDCAERGYLLLPVAEQQLAAGDCEAAYATAAIAAEIGERCGDADLIACARHQQGRIRLQQGQVERGLALLDEVMVAVTAAELSPLVTGLMYCSVIRACQEVYAFGRAGEWTAALARWCEEQPEMVAFTGTCRVHRAEIMQLHGAWQDAIEEAQRARERSRGSTSRPPRRRFTSKQRCTASGGSSRRPRRRIETPASWAGSHSRVSPCCGWRKVAPTPLPLRSAGS